MGSGSSADSSHLRVYIQDIGTYEIFKKVGDDGNPSYGRVERGFRSKQHPTLVWWLRFYIPAFNYGCIGATAFVYANITSKNSEYHAMHNSCHEFAFKLSDCITMKPLAVPITATDTKGLIHMLRLLVVAIPLSVWHAWYARSLGTALHC
jgi:hypothetical protein